MRYLRLVIGISGGVLLLLTTPLSAVAGSATETLANPSGCDLVSAYNWSGFHNSIYVYQELYQNGSLVVFSQESGVTSGTWTIDYGSVNGFTPVSGDTYQAEGYVVNSRGQVKRSFALSTTVTPSC